MRKPLLIACLQVLSTAAFPQTLPFDTSDGVHIKSPELVVHWKASKAPWPNTLWTYRVLPTEFSPVVISNLVALGPFTERDKTYSGANGLVFGHPYDAPYLKIGFTAGTIDYDGRTQHYSPTNLAEGVPGRDHLFELTTNFLPKIGINQSEIARREDGQLRIGWLPTDSSDYTLYMVDGRTITNIWYRRVWVHRALDGLECTACGGDCVLSFGEDSRNIKLELDWRTVAHDKQFAAATPDRIIEWIRQGKAFQKRSLIGHGGETSIDWPAVKSLTVKAARAYYDGECFFGHARADQPILPSWVRPYAEISGIVDTGTTNLKVTIACPVIDETQPLSGRGK